MAAAMRFGADFAYSTEEGRVTVSVEGCLHSGAVWGPAEKCAWGLVAAATEKRAEYKSREWIEFRQEDF